MRTSVTKTSAGYHGALTSNGRVVALSLPCSDRNAAARAGLLLLSLAMMLAAVEACYVG